MGFTLEKVWRRAKFNFYQFTDLLLPKSLEHAIQAVAVSLLMRPGTHEVLIRCYGCSPLTVVRRSTGTFWWGRSRDS